MHYCLRYLSLLLALILVGGFSSCSNDDTGKIPSKPAVEVALGTVGPNSAEINLKTTAIAQYAWLCYPADKAQEPTPTVIFATGVTSNCKDGSSTLTVPDLDAQTDYVVYLAFKTTGNAFYEGVIAPVTLKTTDFTEEVTVIKRTLDGFSAHVKVPKSVADNGNVIKWAVGNALMYNLNQMKGICEASMLVLNDKYYDNFTGSKTFIIDEAHRHKTNESGELILDEFGDPIQNWDFIAPGEPLFLLLGEHSYGESEVGWGQGWYVPLFDYEGYYNSIDGGGGVGPLMANVRADASSEEEFWTGYHKKIDVRAQEPAVLNAKVQIETKDLRPNGGILRFTPDKEVMQYCVCVFDNAMFEGEVMPMLGNKEELLQWFTTSMAASVLLGVQTYTEPTEISLKNLFYEVFPGVPYHIIVTGMGDEAGSTQCFTHQIFELPEATLPAPVVNVKGIKNPDGDDSPYEVWFNLKAPNKDVDQVVYAFNTVSEFAKSRSSYTDLIKSNAQYATLSAREIAQVNSDEGFNMPFSTFADSKMRLAVMGWNIEGTPNNPDEENSPAIADRQSIREPDASRVESSLFAGLVGDWTATASVKFRKYNAQTGKNEWVDAAAPLKTKVIIGSGATYPAVLPEEAYAAYPSKPKAEVDAMYEDLKECVDIFNSKIRGQNRLLCLGYDFDVTADIRYHQLALQTPYDLFIHPGYEGGTMDGVLFDFGPKWYLQIASGDAVAVPVNSNRLAPLAAWGDKSFYLASANATVGLFAPSMDESGNEQAWPNIPVLVSEDKNIITLKKVSYTMDGTAHDLYPSAMYSSYGAMYPYTTQIASEVVLTRGWTAPAKAAVNARNSNPAVPSMSNMLGAPLKSANNAVLKPLEKPRSKTRFSTVAPVSYKVITDYQAVTPEQFQANIEKYNELMKTRNARK